MPSSATTDDLDPGNGQRGEEQPTQALRADAAPTLARIPALPSRRDRCGSCGSPLASDQRYCVECGQRRGPSRVELMERVASPRAEAATEALTERRLPRFSANAALIAAVGTLILAMGVGVLIGRWATSERSGGTPIKVYTVGGGAATGTLGAGTTTTTPTTGAESSGTGSTGSSTTTGGPSGASSTTKSSSGSKAKGTKQKAASKKPKAKVVKVGSKGSGAGYNKKKEFTGEFFGEEEK
ncbi:MAG: hypothetical protein ACYCU0_02235 [Solirubrobacteraceae bacterium]